LEAVAKASHSLFASFLTTETEDKIKYSLTALGNEPQEAELREQLAVYYIERALEVCSSLVVIFFYISVLSFSFTKQVLIILSEDLHSCSELFGS
jgi:hypothetical protein